MGAKTNARSFRASALEPLPPGLQRPHRGQHVHASAGSRGFRSRSSWSSGERSGYRSGYLAGAGRSRAGTQRLLKQLQDKFDMPLTPTVYAALKFAEAQGADLRAIVEAEFGATPKRPKYWYDRDPVVRESLRKVREERELGETPKASQG